MGIGGVREGEKGDREKQWGSGAVEKKEMKEQNKKGIMQIL